MMLSTEQMNALVTYVDESINYKIAEHEVVHHEYEHDLGEIEAEMLKEYDKLFIILVEDLSNEPF